MNKEESNKSNVKNLTASGGGGWEVGEATDRKKSAGRSHLKGCRISSVNIEAN